VVATENRVLVDGAMSWVIRFRSLPLAAC